VRPVFWYWVNPPCLYNGVRTVPERERPNFYLDCKVPPKLFFLGAKLFVNAERREDGTIRGTVSNQNWNSKVVIEECCNGVRVYAPPPDYHLSIALTAAIGALFEAALEVGANSFHVAQPRLEPGQTMYPVYVDLQPAAILAIRRLAYAFAPDGSTVDSQSHLLVILYYLGGDGRRAPYVPDWIPVADKHIMRLGAYGPYSMAFEDMPVEVAFSQADRRVVPLKLAPLPVQRVLFGPKKKASK